MAYEMILTEVRGRVGVVTRNNPERLNALNAVMDREMYEALDAFDQDDAIGAIVLTGAGRAFCAGADVKGWGGEISCGEAGNRMAAAARSDSDESITEKLARYKPVVVAFNGDAIGAGFTITLGADWRIASERLLDRAVEKAAQYAKLHPDTTRAVKRLVWGNLWERSTSEVKRKERLEFAAAQKRPGHREAVRAFVEKREPDFYAAGAE